MALAELLRPLPSPLREDEAGVLRIGGSRVALESIIAAYLDGASADEIAMRFPSVQLGDIHSALAFYHQNRDAVEDYVRHNEELEQEAQESIASRFPVDELRGRLRARHSARMRGSST